MSDPNLAAPLSVGSSTGHIVPVDRRLFTAHLEQLQLSYVGAIAATVGCTVQRLRTTRN